MFCWGFERTPYLLLNYLSNVPVILTVESFTGLTLTLTFEPETSAVIVPLDPLVPTIAYSVIATLSDESKVNSISDISLCVPLSILTTNLPER